MDFQKFDGQNVGDVVSYLKKYLDSMEGEFTIMIGVDSLPHGLLKKRATFTQVVAIHRKVEGTGKGAHCLFRRQSKVPVRNTRERLMKEAFQLIWTLTSQLHYLVRHVGTRK